MTGAIARRIVLALLTLIAASVLVFAATEVLPGDVAEAMLGQSATEETVAAIRERLNLDRPAPVRYLEWVSNAASGDFGRSFTNGIVVTQIIGPRLANTAFLALYAALVAIPLALSLGLLCAAFPDSWFDRFLSSSTIFMVSVPEFVIGVCLVAVLAVEFRLFPAVIYLPDWSDPGRALGQTFLPMLTLVCALLAHMVRMTRAAVIEILTTSYVEMALLKGASKGRIIVRHALPNALGPILSVVALNLGYLFSGVVVVEVVFSYPGLGRLLVDSIFFRDIPVIQITAAIFCGVYIILNTFADLSLVALNPRLRHAA